MDELRTAFIEKLHKVASIEDQIIEALPKLASQATMPDLKQGLTTHLEETKNQRQRLSQIFAAHGEPDEATEDVAFSTLLQESDKELGQITDPNLKDAMIIASCQVVEHIEMAKYGTLVEWAKTLDDSDSEKLLKDTLDEEGNADKTLSKAATGGMFKDGANDMAA